MKLNDIIIISGRIELQSGLHIGAGDNAMRIGGTDNPVVKHPHTNEPYIPGSSLKGKIRSLLEMRSGLMIHTAGKPIGASILNGNKLSNGEKEEAKKILKLFGTSGAESDMASEIGPTRASFADCMLNEDSRKFIKENNLPIFEIKSENSINRIKGVAENPRFTERVVAGLSFDFSITLKYMDKDENDKLEDFLLKGLKLLEMDALGGSGSRGYGRIKFDFHDKARQAKFDSISFKD
jgi:CRISPR-associated protein Csm3